MLRRTELRRGTKELKRTGGLSRSSRLPRKRAKARRGREVDEAHLAFVRTLFCAGCGGKPPNDPHHDTAGRGMGQKADDKRAFPMCRCCHDEFHDGRGQFDGWSKDRRRAWQADQVAAVQALAQQASPDGHA